MEDAAEIVRKLNEQKLDVKLDFLGEFVAAEKEVQQRTDIIKIVEVIV